MKEIIKIENELKPIYNCKATKNSLTIKEGLKFEDWLKIGGALKTLYKANKWWIGDWLNFGERKYGDMYSQALEITDYEYETLKDMKYVAANVEMSCRHDNLSFSHHKEVASLEPKEQEKYLAKAEKENWDRAEMRQNIRDRNKGETPPLPEGKYQIILADPAWEYDRTVGQGVAIEQYQLMGLEQIKELKIKELTAVDCILFLWATFPKLKEALEVIEAWGFEYKTVAFTWIKTNKNNNKPFFGIGSYFKSNAEICLLATKGEPHKFVKDNSMSSVIISPLREHSRKPDEAMIMIERLVGKIPKIQLFSRKKYENWDNWGNETERF